MKKVPNCFKNTLGLVCAGFSLLTLPGRAQTLVNNGAVWYMAPGSLVTVNGGAKLNNGSNVVNNGQLLIRNLGTVSGGNYQIDNGAVTQGNGDYYIEQDWQNDGTFTPNNSHVIFDASAADQFVKGTQNSNFHELTLASPNSGIGMPKLILQRHISIDSLLQLNDRELALQNFNCTISTFDPSAVKNYTTVSVLGTEGFVSTDGSGIFTRKVNQTSAYAFPMGSSSGVKRYRNFEITPQSNGLGDINLRFFNHNPSSDGKDIQAKVDSICFVQEKYYVEWSQSNVPVVDVKAPYVNSTDGNWSGLASWNTNQWNGVKAANAWNDLNGYRIMTVSGISVPASAKALDYVLLQPSNPEITCPGAICPHDSLVEIHVDNSNQLYPRALTYNWQVPGGSSIMSGQGNDTVQINWHTPGQSLNLQVYYAYNGQNCYADAPAICTIDYRSLPDVDFSVQNVKDMEFSFTDLTSPTASAWAWNFGDGSSAATQNPNHLFTYPGTYSVTLVATDQFQCYADTTISVLVDYIDYFEVPNIITPDNDLINDEFFVKHNLLKSFQVDIYNRWGNLIVSSNDHDFKWDGKTKSGNPVSHGTYFYIIQAETVTGKLHKRNGTILVIGNN